MSEEPATIQKPRRGLRTRIIPAALFGLVFLFMGVISPMAVLLEAPLHFVIGWFFHARKTLPPLAGQWSSSILPLVSLLLACILTHRFIGWWLRQKHSRQSWKPFHTISVVSLLLMGSGAAIAMSGIAHQLAWLSGEPWFVNRGRSDEYVQAMSKASKLSRSLAEFHYNHDRYPNSFEELQDSCEKSPGSFQHNVSPDMFVVEVGARKLSEPFIFLKPGATQSLDENEALIASPVLPGVNRIVVGLESGKVDVLPARDLGKLLQCSRQTSSPDE